MIANARETGVATYIGDGGNEWSSVHVDDLARLYVAALTRAEQRLVVNAASRSRIPMRRIAEAVANVTGTRVRSISVEDARRTFGPAAGALTRSSPLDSSRAERVLGWKPAEPGLLDDLRTGSYTAMRPHLTSTDPREPEPGGSGSLRVSGGGSRKSDITMLDSCLSFPRG